MTAAKAEARICCLYAKISLHIVEVRDGGIMCQSFANYVQHFFYNYAQSFCQSCTPFSLLCATYFSYLKIRSLLN